MMRRMIKGRSRIFIASIGAGVRESTVALASPDIRKPSLQSQTWLNNIHKCIRVCMRACT
eukprot:1403825-Pyramimonas_sp.AAC.2